jgi:hypothetical protein
MAAYLDVLVRYCPAHQLLVKAADPVILGAAIACGSNHTHIYGPLQRPAVQDFVPMTHASSHQQLQTYQRRPVRSAPLMWVPARRCLSRYIAADAVHVECLAKALAGGRHAIDAHRKNTFGLHHAMSCQLSKIIPVIASTIAMLLIIPTTMPTISPADSLSLELTAASKPGLRAARMYRP